MPLRSVTVSSIPSALAGDWNSGQFWNVRLDTDGHFYWVTDLPYSIENNQRLHYQTEVCTRIAGQNGIIGRWEYNFPTGEWIRYTYGHDGYYAYEWDNGSSGGGFHSATATHLTVVEFRGSFVISGNVITLQLVDGQLITGTFEITGNSMTIHWQGEEPITYVRIPVVV